MNIIYFARPDSVIDTISVSLSRCKAGELLAESYPVDADVVIGVPDSGMEAALGYANASKNTIWNRFNKKQIYW